ncbi:MAG: DegT/DnrJ/EryC1/StrS aminotransferase [Flavobacteriaceae bacterium]|nr:DegT/DnrJ/EryC1/StrS aminotransferase [Flavobacteriaceae bacterium]
MDCLNTGWISSAGSYVTKFENEISHFVGSKYAVACVNGTSALHVALMLSEVKKDDCVLVPNLTFVATLNAIKYTGASPILIDVNNDDWQMDLNLLEDFLERKTYKLSDKNQFYTYLSSNKKRIKAIVPVHVLGNIGDMDRLIKISKKYNIDIIEDSSEALGSWYKKKHAGTFGKFGVFSFNGNKIISTGGGGIIVTNKKMLARKAKHLTTQAKVSPNEYIHDEVGYNYRLVNVLAAIGLAQLEKIDTILKNKKKIDDFYKKQLFNIGDIVFQKVCENVNPNNWLFTFRTDKMRTLLDYLNKSGVQSRPFWMPMNKLNMYCKDLYVTEQNYSELIYNSSISIPCSAGIKDEEMEKVSFKIKKFYS